MSILSDRQIKNLCVEPTHLVFKDNTVEKIGAPYFPKDEELLKKSRSDRMGGTRRPGEIHAVKLNEDFPEVKDFVPMIKPFEPGQIRDVKRVGTSAMISTKHMSDEERESFWKAVKPTKIISRGLSSFGYDVTLSREFKIFTNVNSIVIDPKNFNDECLADAKLITDETGTYVILPPNSYLLGRTVEYFQIPKDISIVAVGKSTYARAGCIVNVTPIEANFKGNVVIEISNSTPSPLKIYAGEGIAQFIFLRGDEEATVPYDETRKYQNQTGITLPKA